MASRANFYKKISIGGNYQLAPQAIAESRKLEIHISGERLLVVTVGGGRQDVGRAGRVLPVLRSKAEQLY